MLRLVSFGVLAEVVWGRKVARKGGGDEPPVLGDRIELLDSCPEGLVAMGATSLVWGGQEEAEQGVDGHHLHQLPA